MVHALVREEDAEDDAEEIQECESGGEEVVQHAEAVGFVVDDAAEAGAVRRPPPSAAAAAARPEVAPQEEQQREGDAVRYAVCHVRRYVSRGRLRSVLDLSGQTPFEDQCQPHERQDHFRSGDIRQYGRTRAQYRICASSHVRKAVRYHLRQWVGDPEAVAAVRHRSSSHHLGRGHVSEEEGYEGG